MNYLKILISWGFTLVLALIAGFVIRLLPACRRVTVPTGVMDIRSLQPYQNLSLDASVTIADLEREDLICYRMGVKESDRAKFAYVAGLPGDEIEFEGRQILVNGQIFKQTFQVSSELANRAKVVVPIGHLYVLSDRHKYDSTVFGPLPMASVRGRVGVWMK